MLKVNNKNTNISHYFQVFLSLSLNRLLSAGLNEFKLYFEHIHHWRRSGVFIVNFEDVSHLVLLFLLLTLCR